jgi:hypothetical protein
MPTHSFERALARMNADAGAEPLVVPEVLVLPALHRAMGHMMDNLMSQALAVRDAPIALRSFVRSAKHLIPAMIEAMGTVPEAELAGILRYVRTWIDHTLAVYDDGAADGADELPPPWEPGRAEP